MEETLTAPALPVPGTRPIRVPVLAWLAVAVALLLLFEMLQENGTLLQRYWENLHEFFHDGRHFFGVPCH
jgi:Probable cobalt transporter subunit (CbtB)